jgi:hypothetical protein
MATDAAATAAALATAMAGLAPIHRRYARRGRTVPSAGPAGTFDAPRPVSLPVVRFLLVVVLAAAAVLLVAPMSAPGGGTDTDPPLSGHRVEAPQVLAARIHGSAAPAETPAGTLVSIVRSNRLTAIDAASGRRTVRRVKAVAGCGPELFQTGGHIVFAGLVDTRTVVFSVPLSLDRPPRRLGSAHAFVPSATDGRVWLAGVDCSRKRMVGVREVTVDGEPTLASGRRVPGSWVLGAVKDGLVVQRGRALYVWDPGAAGTGRRLDVEAVTATQGNLLVGCPAGSNCRELAILDPNSATEIRPRLRGHRLEPDAAISPDGSLGAVPARANRRWSVALVNTRDGTTSIVPGSDTGDSYPELSWASSTGWLFFRAGTEVMAYRPGEPRAVKLPFRLRRDAIGFVAG